MRVISGRAKGVPLKSPQSSTRPTTGLVREAIFPMLQPLVSRWSKVLDLYAGSGALGIEALSRGAGWVDFVESNRRCWAIIKENLERTGFSHQAHVYRCSVNKALSILSGGYDVIFLDPPYSDPFLLNTLNGLVSSRLVTADTTIMVEHSSHRPLPEFINHFHLIKQRRHGDTCLSIYQQEGSFDYSPLPRKF